MIKFLTAFFFIAAFNVSAQVPSDGPRIIKLMPQLKGRIFGRIVDSAGKGIGDASVLLLQSRFDSATGKSKEELLKGVSTQANGDFNFEDVPATGPVKISISATGFQPLEKQVRFDLPKPPNGTVVTAPAGGQSPVRIAGPLNLEKDLGKMVLQTDVQQLSAVVVSSSGGRLKMDIDKKVFNVDQNIVSAGGTAVDVMRNVPSVNVDIDGNVTMRNATPQIYIDGRPTTLSLDQIPADAIESVEIITNPSAKYDASGGNAGILNIILKKNRKTGHNGNVNIGIDKRGGLNGGANWSVRQDKVNLSLSAFGNQMKNRSTGTTAVTNLLSSPRLMVDQENSTRMNNSFLFARAGIDYFATNRTTFSLAGVKVNGNFNPNEFLRSDSAYEDGTYLSYSERNTISKRKFDGFAAQAGFKHLFPRKGEELAGDIHVFSGRNSSDATYHTDIFDHAGGSKTATILQQIRGSGENRFITLQADYTTPLKGAAKLEAGVRAQLRNMSNEQANYFYDAGSGGYVQVPSSSTNYSNKDNVYAGYVSFKNSVDDFGYQIGLRTESSNYIGELPDTKQSFRNRYPVSLFPSVFLSQKLKESQELQFSYTRRVNRPFFMQQIPFIDSSDQLNWTRGNAALKPEFTNSLEASYSKTYSGNNTLLFSIYYKHSTDLITRYIDTISAVDGTKRPVSTYVNADASRSVGAELTVQHALTKWWDANGNINLYNSKINTDNISGSSQEAMWSWFAKVNNNFKLPWTMKLQLSCTYQSRTNLPVNQTGNIMAGGGAPRGGGSASAAQGYIRSNYGVDLALQKSFLKNNAANVTFSINDIFGTRRFDQFSESAYFIQDNHRLNDVPMFRLNFSFRFGQMDMSIFKRKNTRSEGEGTQNMMQGMQ